MKEKKEIRNIENLISEETKKAEESTTEEKGRNWLPLVIGAAILAVIIAIIIVLAISGSKKETTPTQTETITEESSQQESEVEQVEEESEQLVEESVEEPVVETEEKVAVETMEERLTNLGLQGICVVVWNDSNEEEHVIEEGETYQKVDGDRFFICTPSHRTKVNSSSTSGIELGKPTDNYCEIFF